MTRQRLLDDSSLSVIFLASMLHLAWAGLLVSSYSAAHSTPVAAIVDVFGGRIPAIVMLIVTAGLAMWVSWLHRSPRHLPVRPGYLAMGLIPQQFLLLVSALGGIRAAVLGHYADGVIRPWEFIVGDQLPVILIALLYTTAILIIDRPTELGKSTVGPTLIIVLAAVLGVMLTIAGIIGIWLAMRTAQHTQTVRNFREASESWREKAEALQSDLATMQSELSALQDKYTTLLSEHQVLKNVVSGKAAVETIGIQIEKARGDLMLELGRVREAVEQLGSK